MPIQSLNLRNNTLSGVLPPSWGSAASNLSSLTLTNNFLTGVALHLVQGTLRVHDGLRLRCCYTYTCLVLAQVLFPWSMLPYLA